MVVPNVRAKRATAAGRQARAGENVPRTSQLGPRGTPLGLGLNEGLGTAVLTTGRAAGAGTGGLPTTSCGKPTWRGSRLSKQLIRRHARSRAHGLRRVVRGGAGVEHGTECVQNQNTCRSARVEVTVSVAVVFKGDPGEESEPEETGGWFWWCLTFELSGRRRQDARPGLADRKSVV